MSITLSPSKKSEGLGEMLLVEKWKLLEKLEKVMEKKFFCPAKFAQEIETLVLENKDMNYIDAIVFFCDQNSIDVESVPKLVSKPLKDKIKRDAQELNFMKKTTRAKLPI